MSSLLVVADYVDDLERRSQQGHPRLERVESTDEKFVAMFRDYVGSHMTGSVDGLADIAVLIPDVVPQIVPRLRGTPRNAAEPSGTAALALRRQCACFSAKQAAHDRFSSRVRFPAPAPNRGTAC